MAELITFLVALPVLHMIGSFYYGLCVGLYRMLAAWRSGVDQP